MFTNVVYFQYSLHDVSSRTKVDGIDYLKHGGLDSECFWCSLIIRLNRFQYTIKTRQLTRASQAPNAFPFCHIQSSCNVCKYSFYPSSIVAWNMLPLSTDIFPFTNGIMPTISSMIRLL